MSHQKPKRCCSRSLPSYISSLVLLISQLHNEKYFLKKTEKYSCMVYMLTGFAKRNFTIYEFKNFIACITYVQKF